MLRLFVLLTLPFVIGCYQFIDSGHIGVRVTSSGTNKGIDPKPLGVGRAWYNPIMEQIYEFPVCEQNVLWSGPDAITVSSSQSAQIVVDVGLTFEIRDDMVPVLFDKLRKDIDYIDHQWLRNHVRDALERAASHAETMKILGEGKDDLLVVAKADLNSQLGEYGIKVLMLSFASSPRPNAKIQSSIDATTTAKQLAIQLRTRLPSPKLRPTRRLRRTWTCRERNLGSRSRVQES